MSTRTLRARVHAGNLEPLEDLALTEGAEVTVVIEIPSAVQTAHGSKLSVWNLGAPEGLTRKDYYDDAG